jgi:hypothetical protein
VNTDKARIGEVFVNSAKRECWGDIMEETAIFAII